MKCGVLDCESESLININDMQFCVAWWRIVTRRRGPHTRTDCGLCDAWSL